MPANTQTTVSTLTGVPESFAISRSINAEYARGLDANSSIESFPFNGSFDIINGTGNVGTFNDSREITWTTYGMRFTNLLSRVEFGTEPTTSIVGNPKVNQIQSGSVIIESKDLNLEAATLPFELGLYILYSFAKILFSCVIVFYLPVFVVFAYVIGSVGVFSLDSI